MIRFTQTTGITNMELFILAFALSALAIVGQLGDMLTGSRQGNAN